MSSRTCERVVLKPRFGLVSSLRQSQGDWRAEERFRIKRLPIRRLGLRPAPTATHVMPRRGIQTPKQGPFSSVSLREHFRPKFTYNPGSHPANSSSKTPRPMDVEIAAAQTDLPAVCPVIGQRVSSRPGLPITSAQPASIAT